MMCSGGKLLLHTVAIAVLLLFSGTVRSTPSTKSISELIENTDVIAVASVVTTGPGDNDDQVDITLEMREVLLGKLAIGRHRVRCANGSLLGNLREGEEFVGF